MPMVWPSRLSLPIREVVVVMVFISYYSPLLTRHYSNPSYTKGEEEDVEEEEVNGWKASWMDMGPDHVSRKASRAKQSIDFVVDGWLMGNEYRDILEFFIYFIGGSSGVGSFTVFPFPPCA